VKIHVYLDEFMMPNVRLYEEEIEKLEKLASERLQEDIVGVIEKVQSEYGADIFGFGDLIHKKDFELWNQLKYGWDSTFRTLPVEVKADVHIINTALLCRS
jgi:spore germination protein KC